ncbi:bifunctional demethylmenaquinone methyltransferase/2-methoxy-6-polyprenyl-1,4-benzoquinol methylase UbiE [Anabaena cylindrica FACHB-243]|uniref:2-phytyl-1,4-naphtoquinone methyltransferase n=1 Tax=Anabaena cylindrica (strain ATCC 27899 / PCC 7122) TaxID=272123 RepID=K9ZNN7_ANACC|nr:MULTISPECIES: bifunctional demethylmenaquinone methyltransferase/2-methoxy-6-polyprenyl-1,4-benzoquinol methylase UbiE [Anabaena]AFZ60404.1 demethylmenaquinone methyltransferase [Anabaena cylindrica PCC 7122]MBD2416392.1 bifunctional demethylmenaquinone methyltransferase/2-methoxy-6-polyprenyl-1,4-benzoquinol methylase UbiE [Anabaena cylindrica FACHB-243]MBY5285578.1 bifunctional demethylmenaquinone methyltransferase/2-methoxy-6-polyprenyl-1,4-benzoquinol methylase UbiE [Anabaena sp. CCAP 144
MSNEIRDIFDRIAPVYDQLNDWLSLGQHRIWKEMTVKWSAVKPGDTCLDLCCGSGDLTFRLARYAGVTGKVYGVDFSCNLLTVAKERCHKYYPQASITWLEADVLNLPFDDNQFDAITMGYGLRNVKDIPLSLQEIYRVLKPGGKAAILDFHKPSNAILRTFQQWYLDNLVVPLATNLGVKEEYAYISPSLDRFPIGQEQVRIAQKIGFVNTIHYPISNDMMGVLVVNK